MTTIPFEEQRRAVYCACCGQPTGEFVKGPQQPKSPYCSDCENLPSPWEVRAKVDERTGQYVRDEAGRPIYDTIIRERRINVPEEATEQATVGAPPTFRVRFDPGLRYQDEDDEDEDDEPRGVRCPNCDADRFQLQRITRERQYCGVVEGDDYAPGDTLYFYADVDDAETMDVLDEWVECFECGQRYTGPWQHA